MEAKVQMFRRMFQGMEGGLVHITLEVILLLDYC